MLTASGRRLCYYTLPDGNNHNYEADFLLSKDDKVVPVEVKSSGYRNIGRWSFSVTSSHRALATDCYSVLKII